MIVNAALQVVLMASSDSKACADLAFIANKLGVPVTANLGGSDIVAEPGQSVTELTAKLEKKGKKPWMPVSL